MFLKSSAVEYLSKCCSHCTSQLLKKNFEYRCVQVTFEKITIKVAEVALIQVSFPNVAFKQKTKMNTRNNMASSYKSQVYSKHGSITFLFFWSWSLVLYLHVLVKLKFFLITLTYKLS